MGVLGLLPDVFWSLSWPDYDSLLFHHQYRQQQELIGHRMTATQVYNAMQGFAKTPKGKTQAEYWPLLLLDQPPPPLPPKTWWDKMKDLSARSGLRWPSQPD